MRLKTPQSEAGTRSEPLVSEPSEIGARPAAVAAPQPEDDPPHIRARVVRVAADAVVRVLAGEVVGVLAHVERAEQHGAGGVHPPHQRGVARRAGARSRLIFEPARVGRPATSKRFFTAKGTPASGPGGRPAARAGVDGRGLGQRPLGGDVGIGVEPVVQRADPGERRLGDGAGGDGAAGDGGGDLAGARPGAERVRHRGLASGGGEDRRERELVAEVDGLEHGGHLGGEREEARDAGPPGLGDGEAHRRRGRVDVGVVVGRHRAHSAGCAAMAATSGSPAVDPVEPGAGVEEGRDHRVGERHHRRDRDARPPRRA